MNIQHGRIRDRLLRIVSQFPRRRILVAGDLIADEFLYGQIARVSREAPVLVLEYRDLLRLPGGAANAANNLLDLGCQVTIAAVTGNDDAGSALIEVLSRKGAEIKYIQRADSYFTPVKTRILAGAHHSSPQQVVRIDRVPGASADARRLWNRVIPQVRRFDGIVLSDYGYGSANPGAALRIAAAARSLRRPVVVDSRFRMGEFSRVTAITPNITELEAAAGISIGSDSALLSDAARAAMSRQRLSCLLVTQGRFGMTLFEPRKDPVHIPVFGTDEVADVTGAGDTVISVFTLALACGAAPEDAARLSNYAGGIVVMKRGTATVTSDELRAAIGTDRGD